MFQLFVVDTMIPSFLLPLFRFALQGLLVFWLLLRLTCLMFRILKPDIVPVSAILWLFMSSVVPRRRIMALISFGWDSGWIRIACCCSCR